MLILFPGTSVVGLRNQPINSAVDDFHDSSQSSPDLTFRSRILVAGFVLAVAIVLARIVYVQSCLQNQFLTALDVTTTEYEIIPARDGRILAANAVLATDVDEYSVEVHFRWLQSTADAAWKRRWLRSQLSVTERRDPRLVALTEKELSEERNSLWQRLSDILDVDEASLAEQRTAIERRVERIALAVNRRHASDSPDDDVLQRIDSDHVLIRMGTAIRSALTTSPNRTIEDRIVVREEEDFHSIAEGVPLETAAWIREHPNLFPGVRVRMGTQRIYPKGRLASHAIGARTALKDGELKPYADVSTSDFHGWTPRQGRFGIELSHDREVHGVPGLRRITRNRKHQIIEDVVEQPPVAGRDVVLTIDTQLQAFAEALLAEALTDAPATILSRESETDQPGQPVPTGGSIVVMDIHDGRIEVAASAPGFDLSLFTSGSEQDWQNANADQRFPFITRYIGMSLPPGSVFKPLTAAAAMESGYLDPQRPFYCQGYLNNPQEHRCLVFRQHGIGHEDVELKHALAESCNVYFFSAARRMGVDPIVEWAKRFGFGRATGVDLPFEKKGTLPAANRTGVTGAAARRYFEREALGLAIGQSRLTVTPLQIARMMAAIANDGWLVTPHITSDEGIARTSVEPRQDSPRVSPQRIEGLHRDTLSSIREGLRAAVEEPYGTGYRTVRLNEVPIAGKSGTAETSPDRPDHAWFAGYVPADHPQFAYVVVLEHGGSGSRAAGPVAREMVRRMHQLGRLEEPLATTSR